MEGIAAPAPMVPASLVDGVDALVARKLNVISLRHRGALRKLPAVLPDDLVDAVAACVAANWAASRAAERVGSSRENWRWRAPQLAVNSANRSPEVMLERAIVNSDDRIGRRQWANQVPVASGLVIGAGDRRRAIDLVYQHAPGHFELIELKIASDTPLYAAVEIISYAAIWLQARVIQAADRSDLLNAWRIDLRVLAPAAYYRPYDLSHLDRALARQTAALGERNGVELSFAFNALPDELISSLPDLRLLELLDQRNNLTPGGR